MPRFRRTSSRGGESSRRAGDSRRDSGLTNRRRALAALTVAAACAWGTAAAADDWPQWQGPDRNAMSGERGLLQEWTPDGPPLAWKVEGLGGGQEHPLRRRRAPLRDEPSR